MENISIFPVFRHPGLIFYIIGTLIKITNKIFAVTYLSQCKKCMTFDYEVEDNGSCYHHIQEGRSQIAIIILCCFSPMKWTFL